MSDTEKKQTVRKETAKRIPEKTGTVVYIGPDIPGAKQYTTYNAGLPDVLKEKIKKYPYFECLIVPVEKLSQANAELAMEGSALSLLYRKASER